MLSAMTLLAILAPPQDAPAPVQAQPLDWMVGHWCTASDRGASTCETWTRMDKGVMLGETVERAGGREKRERMSISINESGVFFHAEPAGQPPADFRALPGQGMAVTFENRAHDYPQRVRYWRDGDLLIAEISLADGSKPVRWAYHRAKN